MTFAVDGTEFEIQSPEGSKPGPRWRASNNISWFLVLYSGDYDDNNYCEDEAMQNEGGGGDEEMGEIQDRIIQFLEL